MSPPSSVTRQGLCTVRTAGWGNDNHALRLVREAVFIREQGIPVELEWDEHDSNSIHLLALDTDDNPIGTARLSPDGSIGRMAVLEAWRKKGVGGCLLRHALNEARNRQMHKVSLNAQLHAVDFYCKFGFRMTGEVFMDAGIPHVRMLLRR